MDEIFTRGFKMKQITINDIAYKKNREKIVMLTAYDALFAKLFDDYVDIILVGDSLNMSFGGQKDTLNLSLESMIYHAKAVKNATKKSLVVADMPFGSTTTPQKTLKNAIKIYKESGVDAVKIEGGEQMAPTIKLLSDNGIAVCAHIGLMPQLVRAEGGYKIKGRNGDEKLLSDARAVAEAGAFAVVVEGTISSVAKKITQSVKIPTIGIGSGVDTDGQVLVWSDMLGFFEEFRPKFAKSYLNGAELVREAVQRYASEVKNARFPSEEFEYKA